MQKTSVEGIGGWLLVYLIGSIPPLIVYSMGLSGWFFDYPPVLMLAIFLALAIPLGLLLVRSPKAPRWNVMVLWTIVILMTLRAITVFLTPLPGEEMSAREMLGVVGILFGIIGFAVGWALAWTLYFRNSERVRNTF